MENDRKQPTTSAPEDRGDLEFVIGQRIRALREAQGMSQAQLGQKLASLGFPMEQPTVYKLEKGTRPIRVNEVAAAAAVLGVEIEDLLSPQMGADHHLARVNLSAATARLDGATKELEHAEARARAYQHRLSLARKARDEAFAEWEKAAAELNKWIKIRD
ncbi:helix-turn-helix domain-containing protein [Modestobacter sp. SYSU DS0875]